LRWAGERHENDIIFGDTESAGFSPYHDRMRLVQVGDMHAGWAFGQGWWGAAVELLARYPRIGFHNSPYDWRVIKRHTGTELPWERIEDTLTAAHITDSLKLAGLKPRSAQDIDPRAAAGEQVLHDGMAANRWTWDTVPEDWEPYWCVPETTEILTRSGWKHVNDVLSSDETLGWADGELHWTPVVQVRKFPAQPVVRFGNKWWSTVATENHRWLVRQREHRQGKDEWSAPHFATTREAWKGGKRTILQLTGYADGGSSPCTPDEARVIAWLLSDGTIDWQRDRSSPNPQIWQSVHKYHEEIRLLLKREGAYVSERFRDSNSCYRFQVSAAYVQRLWDAYGLFDGLDEFTLSLSKEARRAWVDAWYKAEGSRDRALITQNAGPKADAVALSLFLEGFLPRISEKQGGCLDIRMSQRPVGNTRNAAVVYEDAGTTDVWCPTTGLGSWVARDKDGRIFLTGNCYSALDPVLAAHLWNRFGPQVTTTYRQAYDLEKATTRISAGMMDTGMAVDLPYIREKIARISGFREQAMAWLGAEFGIRSVGSNKQVMAALNAVGIPTRVWTDGGQPSISKEALAFYAYCYPEHAHLVKTIRYARKAGDIVGKYLQKFLDLHVDGTMHYTINTCRARTSRESVTDPPMQTFDRDEPVIRGSFIPRPGHRLISIDADQIEMRMTAHFSQDRQLIADFLEADRNGESFFVLSASRMFREPISKKDPRYTHTKNASYGQVYGAGLDKAAATAGIPLEEMRPIYMGFQQRYPGVPQLMNRLVNQGKRGRERPYATAIDGRKLYVRRGREYSILNTMVQGSAAVVLKNGLVQMDAAGLGPYLRLDIHDEHILEAPEDIAGEVLRKAGEILTDRETFRVPLTWDGKVLDYRWVKT
jgi:DNA polymerase I-like protein with 3'-5' exonuclease and polymerase domains